MDFDPGQVGRERLSSVQYLTIDTQGRVPMALVCDLPAHAGRVVLSDGARAALAADLADAPTGNHGAQ